MSEYCNFDSSLSKICNLTCQEHLLEKVKENMIDEFIGGHFKATIYRCVKCKNYWKVFEEYDSHHGFFREAIKPNESISHFELEIKFEEKEITDIN